MLAPFPLATYGCCTPAPVGLKVWSLDQQHQPPPGACWELTEADALGVEHAVCTVTGVPGALMHLTCEDQCSKNYYPGRSMFPLSFPFVLNCSCFNICVMHFTRKEYFSIEANPSKKLFQIQTERGFGGEGKPKASFKI